MTHEPYVKECAGALCVFVFVALAERGDAFVNSIAKCVAPLPDLSFYLTRCTRGVLVLVCAGCFLAACGMFVKEIRTH